MPEKNPVFSLASFKFGHIWVGCVLSLSRHKVQRGKDHKETETFNGY